MKISLVFHFKKRGVASSGRSECSTSLSFSSPTPSRRSFQRRTTLPSGHFSARSESCSPFRMPTNSGKLSSNDDRSLHHHQQHHHHHQSNIRSSGSPATSISSGLGRSFSPASAHSYQRPPCNFLTHFSCPSSGAYVLTGAFYRPPEPSVSNSEHGFTLLIIGGTQC